MESFTALSTELTKLCSFYCSSCHDYLAVLTLSKIVFIYHSRQCKHFLWVIVNAQSVRHPSRILSTSF